MKASLLAAVVLLFGCKSTPPPPAPPADKSPPAGVSRGFGAAPSVPSAPEDKSKLPAELAARPIPEKGVAVYVDGALKRNLSAIDLQKPMTLESAAGGPARMVLAHGAEGDNLWIAGKALGQYQLRMNRRELVKLEPIGSGGGAHSEKEGRTEQPDHPGRAGEIRGLAWLEVRTPASAKVSGEPN